MQSEQKREFSSLTDGPRSLSEFEHKMKIFFHDKGLLKRAFTHCSYQKENRILGIVNNERLEFLGDAVLELIVTTHLYKKYPLKQEGDLSNCRSALVSTAMFGEIAYELGMEKYLLMSKGETMSFNKSFRHILADTFEAFVAALYLDQGYNAAEMFVSSNLFQRIDGMMAKNLFENWKTILQQKAQEKLKVTPTYKVLEEFGPPHDRQFVIIVKFGNREGEKGVGKSKAEAGKDAALNTLKKRGWL